MKEKVLKGIFWLGGASIVSQVITWLSTIVVARLLAPADYGLIALAGIYIGFVEYLNEFGIGAALIQRKDLNEQDVKSIYSVSIAIGLAMTMLTFFLAPVVADFFKEVRLTSLLQVLSLTFIINAAKSNQRNLMIRDMKFAELAKMDGGSRILTSFGALALAWAGLGVWTLAIQYLLQNLIVFIWAFAYERRLPGRITNLIRLKEMLVFGVGITGTNVLYCTNRNVDSFLVGKLLGKVTLGYYTFAQTLADKPFEKLLTIFNQVFFPLLTKVQDDPTKMRKYFFIIMEKEVFILTPIFVTLILTARELVFVLLGSKWEIVILPLQVFAAIAVCKYLENRINTVYRSVGKSRAPLQFTTALAVVMATSLYLGGTLYALPGVLAAWGMVYPLVFMVYLHQFLKFMEMSWSECLGIFKVPAMVTVLMAIGVAPLSALFPTPTLVALVFKVCMAVTIYFIVNYIANKKVILELRDLMLTQFGKTPAVCDAG